MNSGKIKNICIAFLSLVLFVYLVLFINSLMHNEKVGFFNARFYIMPADSAELGFNQGDLVIAKTIKPEKLKENDKVLYRKDSIINVKEIISTNSSGDKVNLVIKNNSNGLSENVEDATVIGKVIGKINRIGNVALFVQSPLGTLNMVLLISCVFVVIKKLYNRKEESI